MHNLHNCEWQPPSLSQNPHHNWMIVTVAFFGLLSVSPAPTETTIGAPSQNLPEHASR